MIGKHHQINRAAQIFQRAKSHGLTIACRMRFDLDQHAPNLHLSTIGQIHQIIYRSHAHFRQIGSVAFQRMSRKIKAQHIFFTSEAFALGPFRHLGQRLVVHRLRLHLGHFKHGNLPARAISLYRLRHLQCAIHGLEQLRAMPGHAIISTGLNQTFNTPPVHSLRIHAVAKIKERLKRTICFTRRNNRLNRAAPHIANGGHAHSDLIFGRHKIDLPLIHIRGQDVQTHPPAFFNQNDQTLDIANFTVEIGRHKFGRIMRLEIRALVSHHRIARAVRLVESIARENLDIPPYLFCNLFFNAIGTGTL